MSAWTVGRISRLRTAAVVTVALAVMAAVMTATPSTATPEAKPVTKLKPSPDKNTKKGSESDRGKAQAKARKSKKRVEVKSEQTTTESVFANPDGTFSQEKAATPIRAKDANGKLAPIDTDLTKRANRLNPKVATGEVSFSAAGDGELATYEVAEGASVGVDFARDLGAPKVDGSAATYSVAGSKTETVKVAALPDGFTSHVVLAEAPKTAPTYSFALNLDGLTAALKDNRLELSNDQGKVVATSRPFQMWDAARDTAGDPSNVAAVDAKLIDTANGSKTLQLTPSMAYLSNPTTKYPVTVDPDIAKVEARGDTYYFNGQSPTDSRGSDYRLRTGYQDGATHRSLVTFGYEDYVGQTVTKATLKLRQYSSATCTAKQNEAHPIKADVPGTITWDTRPQIEDTARFRSTNTSNHGQSGDGCPDDFEDFDVTPQISAWAGGTLNSDTAGLNRQGIELRAASENDGSYDKRFCSLNLSGDDDLNCNESEYVPVLSVTYAPELGDQDFYSMTKHPLNDKSSLAINNKSGNALVTANDASVNARGIPFDLTRSYNSQSPAVSSMGYGWNLGVGPDVWVEKQSKYRYDFHAPDGTHFGSFVRKTADSGDDDYDNFISPLGGVGAKLDQDFDGSSSDTNDDPNTPDIFIVTMNDSQTQYRFTEQLSTGDAYLTRVTDRSGNIMDLSYSGVTSSGPPKLNSVTDAGGRTYNVTYTGDYITKIAESGGLAREWKYEYTGDYMTSYTDADNKTTDYAYETGFDGPDLLKTITDPPSSAGARPTTHLTYGQDSDLNVEEVTTVSYVLDGSITYQYSWDYHSSENHTPVCEDHGDFSTEVTDPNNTITTYCYKPRDEAGGKMKQWVFDGEERELNEDFNIDRQSENLTSGQSGTTVKSYGASMPDQLKTVKDPNSGSSTSGERTNIDYDHDHDGGGDNSPKGGDYIPASVTDPNGDCTRFEYDSTGRATAAITKLRGSGTDRSCANDFSGGAKYQFVYNSDGTLKESVDANSSGTSVLDERKTIYTYWATTDPGYVAGSKGLIKSVRKPGGNCATTSSRKLCTSYTYDAGGRVKTVVDGKNITTTMEYDKLDRTTKVLFNGAAACGTGNANCVTYAYDAEGNMTKRSESAGDTDFTYDRLNRQLSRTQPDGVSMQMSYDGVSNMTQFKQSIGSETDIVDYAYDGGNMIDTVTDTSGAINVGVNDDALIEQIIFPGTGQIKMDLDFKDNDKPASLSVLKNGTEQRKYIYDYTDGDDDEDQLQSRTASGPDVADGSTSYQYEYGRLDTAVDTAGPNYDYAHDNIGNVIAEKITSTTTYYGYDRAGQLCYKSPVDGSDVATNCPTPPAGATTYNLDAAGNNLNTAGDPTTYNNHNQVTGIGGLAMEYLDLGNDLRTDVGGTQLVEGPLGISAQKIGSAITWYTRMPDGTILDARKPGGATQNYATEPHNKSVAALYAPNGDLVGSYGYSPYGKTAVNAETGGSVAADNPFRYISGYQDTAGAEDYYKLGARYYDGHGHFTQPDPLAGSISDPRSMTAYNYGLGDPINLSDASGYSAGKPRGKCGVYINGYRQLWPGCPGYKDPSAGYPMRRQDWCVIFLAQLYPGTRAAQGARALYRAGRTELAKVDGIFAAGLSGGLISAGARCFG